MNAPKSAIAAACGLLLQRGVPADAVLEVERRLRLLAEGGLAAVVELPEHRLAVRLSPSGGARRRHLHRPGSVG